MIGREGNVIRKTQEHWGGGGVGDFYWKLTLKDTPIPRIALVNLSLNLDLNSQIVYMQPKK